MKFDKFFLAVAFLIIFSSSAFGVVINEFFSNGEDDWIELFNPSNSDVNLSGWMINDTAPVLPVHVFGINDIIEARGYFTIDVNNRLNDGGDIIFLKNDLGIIVDKVVYGSSAPVPGNEQSAGRFPNGMDTNNDSNDFKLFEPEGITRNRFNCPIYNIDKDVCYNMFNADVALEDFSENESLNLFNTPIDPESLESQEITEGFESENIIVEIIGGDEETRGTVVVAEYLENPSENDPVFNIGSSFFDVFFVLELGSIDNLEIIFCGAGGNFIYWWNGEVWRLASNQEIVQVEDQQCVKITVDENTSPSLDDLDGTPFGGGNPVVVQVPIFSFQTLLILFALISIIGSSFLRK